MSRAIRSKYFNIGFWSLIVFASAFFVLPRFLPATFVINQNNGLATINRPEVDQNELVAKKIVKHQETPEAVKGIYMTACVAGTPSFRSKLVELIKKTELNSVIIDVKDYTGTVSFFSANPKFKDNDGGGCRVTDLPEFVKFLHENNIYVIARITAFQDPYMAKHFPDWAVKKNSDKTIVWKDFKGISYIDAGNKEMWQYLVDLGKESYAVGFDEINFDYVRFPSDGNMKDIYFPWSADTLYSSTSTVSRKSLVMKGFFEYLHNNFKDTGIVTSVDLFGMTTTNYDDLNIGQILEDAIPNFDYIAPMVYPSHYPAGFNGYANVNNHPYDIVKFSLGIATGRLLSASSTPLKLRPWLQDNDYPVPYTPAMVRTQIQATYDSGLTSWMLWDAGNTYTQDALLAE